MGAQAGFEEGAEGAGAAFDLGGGGGGEQRVDHGDQVDAAGDQPGRGVEGDAADGHQRQVEARLGLVQQFEAGGGGARFGAGLEEAAEGDVAGALGHGLLGQFQVGVAGGADDGLAAEQGAGRGQRTVGLAEVQADAQARGQFGVVVDDQLRAVACAEFAQALGLAQAARGVVGFVAVLQQLGARLFGGRLRRRAAGGRRPAAGYR